MNPDPVAFAADLAALAWQVEVGADEAIGEAPVDRFETRAAPAERAAPKAPPAAAAAPVRAELGGGGAGGGVRGPRGAQGGDGGVRGLRAEAGGAEPRLRRRRSRGRG